MTALEIILLVIGIGAVIVSFRLSDHEVVSQKEEGQEREQEEMEEFFSKIKEGKDTFEEWIGSKVEQAENDTEDRLSTVSNEKMIGMNEYSDQIFDKMEKNHGEVVFLYDMLNEKEEEIKKLIHEIDIHKTQWQEEEVKQFQQLEETIKKAETLQKSLEVLTSTAGTTKMVKKPAKTSERRYMKPTVGDSSVRRVSGIALAKGNVPAQKNVKQSSVYDAEIAKIEEAEEKDRQRKEQERKLKQQKKQMVQQNQQEERVQEQKKDDYKDKIITLYKKGRSILEISKMLSIGQGEVKFVIDLYNSK